MQEGGLLERINRTLEQITIIQDNKKISPVLQPYQENSLDSYKVSFSNITYTIYPKEKYSLDFRIKEITNSVEYPLSQAVAENIRTSLNKKADREIPRIYFEDEGRLEIYVSENGGSLFAKRKID